MNPRVEPIVQFVTGNAALYAAAVRDVDADTAVTRPGDRASSLAYVVCHLLDARAWMVGMLGGDGTHEFSERFKQAKGIDELDPPPLSDVAAAFEAVTARLVDRLESLTDEDLDAPMDSEFPFAPKTIIGGITFLAWHESYHIGQLGLLRSYLGLSSLTGR